jgi:hypothetical protein
MSQVENLPLLCREHYNSKYSFSKTELKNKNRENEKLRFLFII